MSAESIYWTGSIFFWLLITGIGLPPLPEEAGILYAAGLSALHPEVTWWMAWPAAASGIIGADLLLYGLGRWVGERIFEYRWVRRVFSAERRERLQGRFHDHGLKVLLLARLLPPLRTGVFLMAGSMRFPLTHFLIADGAYGVVGVGLVFFGGTTLLALVHGAGNWLLLLAAAAVVAYLLYRYYRYLKKLELKATVQVVETIAPKSITHPSDKQSAAP